MNEPGEWLARPVLLRYLGAVGRQRPLLRYMEMFLQGKAKNGSGEVSAGESRGERRQYGLKREGDGQEMTECGSKEARHRRV